MKDLLTVIIIFAVVVGGSYVVTTGDTTQFDQAVQAADGLRQQWQQQTPGYSVNPDTGLSSKTWDALNLDAPGSSVPDASPRMTPQMGQDTLAPDTIHSASVPAAPPGTQATRLESQRQMQEDNLGVGEATNLNDYEGLGPEWDLSKPAPTSGDTTDAELPSAEESWTAMQADSFAGTDWASQTYVVQRGDWLHKIANQFDGVSTSDIKRANGIGNTIYAGQELTIPGADFVWSETSEQTQPATYDAPQRSTQQQWSTMQEESFAGTEHEVSEEESVSNDAPSAWGAMQEDNFAGTEWDSAQ